MEEIINRATVEMVPKNNAVKISIVLPRKEGYGNLPALLVFPLSLSGFSCQIKGHERTKCHSNKDMLLFFISVFSYGSDTINRLV